MEDLKDLRVWTKAHELTLVVHEQTRTFPREEMYQVARGSVSEVEYHQQPTEDLQFLTADGFQDLEGKVLEVQRMLASHVQRRQSPILARC